MSDKPDAVFGEQAGHYTATLDCLPHGICFFDRDNRLFFCNGRYAEIYDLAPGDLVVGMTAHELAGRVAASDTALPTDGGPEEQASSTPASQPRTWTAVLPDGRHIRVGSYPMPDGGRVETHEDVTAHRALRADKHERLSLQSLVDCLPDYLWVKDRDSRFVVVNKALALDCGRARTSDMIGLTDFDLHPYDAALEFRASEMGILRNGWSIIDREEMVFDSDGNRMWLSSTKVPLYDEHDEIVGIIGSARDITAAKLATYLLDGQAKLFESMATNVPVARVLDQIALLVEFQSQGLFCVITTLSRDNTELRCRAAPSLSDLFAAEMDRMSVGPKAASCGTAIYRRAPVVVTDIETDPLWEDYRPLAEAHEFRACWSTPFFSHAREPLGTVAMYSRAPRSPTAEETKLSDLAAHMAAIAIEQHDEERDFPERDRRHGS